MGNQSLPSTPPLPIKNQTHPHLGQISLLSHNNQNSFLKVQNFPDPYHQQATYQLLKARQSKLSQNTNIINIYHIDKIQKKDLCINSIQLRIYLEHYEHCLSDKLRQRLQKRWNYQQVEILYFMRDFCERISYMMDNGVKNVSIDKDAVVFCGGRLKIIDTGIAVSNSYFKLISNLESKLPKKNPLQSFYLAPQILKDLKQLNYDPYVSPKSDVFSLGMLALQMICLQSMNNYYDYIKCEIDYDNLIHRLSKINYSVEMKTILAEMLQYEPQARIGFISLYQKLTKLIEQISEKPQSTITRSRSSKMLKQMLSQSRRSSSIGKSLTSRSIKNSEQKNIQNSHCKSSAESIKSYSKNNSAQKMDNQCKRSRKIFAYEMDDNKMEVNTLKNIVKSKLNKDKNKQNLTQIHSVQLKPHIQKVEDHKFNNCESSVLPSQKAGPLSKLIQENNIKNILKVQNIQQVALNSNLENESMRNTSRFGQSSFLKQASPNIENSDTKRNKFFDFTSNNKSKRSQIDSLMEVKLQSLPSFQKDKDKIMTFSNSQLNKITEKQLVQEKTLKNEAICESRFEKLAFSPIISQNNRSVSRDIEIVFDESPQIDKSKKSSNTQVISQEKWKGRDQKPLFSKFNKKINMFNCEVSPTISESKENLKTDQQKQPPRQKVTSMNTSQIFKKLKPKKPLLVLDLDQSHQTSRKLNQIQVQFKKQNQVVANKIKSRLDLMYNKTSKSIEQFSIFSNKKQPQITKPQYFESNINNCDFQPINNIGQFNKIVLENGKIYEGQLASDCTIHGNGILYSSDHQIQYSGSWRNGQYNGFGTLYNLCQKKEKQVDHKNLDLNFRNWEKYEGQFENGQKNGFGTIFYLNGQKFSGCLKREIIEGYGCFYKKEGGLVSGLWAQNKLKKF